MLGFHLLVLLTAVVVAAALYVSALVLLLRSTTRDTATKVIWALIILLLPFVGAAGFLLAELVRVLDRPAREAMTG